MNKKLIYGLISILVIFTLFLSFATPTTPLFSTNVVKIGDLFETSEDPDDLVYETNDDSSSSCFLEDTKILMADSTLKDIEDVKVGDYVSGYNNGKYTKSKVLELESPMRNDYYIVTLADGTKLRVTDEHPMYARNGKSKGWSSINPKASYKDSGMVVNNLNTMNELFTTNGWSNIEDIEQVKKYVRTYNLKSVNGNVFFADGVLVHNKGGCLQVVDVAYDVGQESMNPDYDGGDQPPDGGDFPPDGGDHPPDEGNPPPPPP